MRGGMTASRTSKVWTRGLYISIHSETDRSCKTLDPEIRNMGRSTEMSTQASSSKFTVSNRYTHGFNKYICLLRHKLIESQNHSANDLSSLHVL